MEGERTVHTIFYAAEAANGGYHERYSSIIILTLCILLMFSPAAAYAADYTVQTSDSLYKIGQLFQVPVSTLKLDNHLSTDMIYPGQVLYVPSQIYTIKSGDTLYLIAKRNGLSLTALRKANAKWDNLIIPGQTLILPGVNTKESTKTDSNKNCNSIYGSGGRSSGTSHRSRGKR